MSWDRRQLVLLAESAALAPGACTRRPAPSPKADHTIRIAKTRFEVAPGKIVEAVAYNDQFPGPLLKFKEGRPVTVDIVNDTDTPEQLHWHGQFVPVDVDGAAEEGTPYVPAHGARRISFTPGPSGLRFYHAHCHQQLHMDFGFMGLFDYV